MLAIAGATSAFKSFRKPIHNTSEAVKAASIFPTIKKEQIKMDKKGNEYPRWLRAPDWSLDHRDRGVVVKDKEEEEEVLKRFKAEEKTAKASPPTKAEEKTASPAK